MRHPAAGPAGILPGLADRAAQLGEHLRCAAAHDPAVNQASHAAEAGRIDGAEDQLPGDLVGIAGQEGRQTCAARLGDDGSHLAGI